jgi:aromatic-L-amino-acid decarboxylase
MGDSPVKQGPCNSDQAMDELLEKLQSPDRCLEMDGSELREVLETVLGRLLPHVDSIDTQLAWEPPEAGPDPDGSLPNEPNDWDGVIQELFEDRLYPAYNPASGGYMGYVPGGGLLHSAVADLIANAVNRYVTVWQTAPRLAEMEAEVVDWFRQLVGLPETGGGYLTTGGSLANWSAVVTARKCRLPDNFLEGLIYTSDQAHHSIARAASMAGFPAGNVRIVESDSEYRVCLDRLREQIDKDKQAGGQPFMVVGHAGTTNTGAVDDLVGLAQVCQQHQLWFHIDAAYGGPFMLTERGREILQGIGSADSVTLDPHKGMFLPYGTGCLLVRDRQDLHRTHAVDVDYMPAMQDDPYRVNICQISPELSRDCRGLRVWLPVKIHGLGAFGNYLDEKLDLARWAVRELETIPGIEILAAPQLSILAFRLAPEGLEADALEELNREFLDRINRATQRCFLSPTSLGGAFAIRICVIVFRTHLEHVQHCIDLVRQAAAELLAGK